MNEKYILAALMGTKDGATDKYPFIKLYAKKSEIAGLLDEDAPGGETTEETFIAVGVIGVLNPATNEIEPINLYASFGEWLNLSMIAGEHITGGDSQGQEETQ